MDLKLKEKDCILIYVIEPHGMRCPVAKLSILNSSVGFFLF